MGQKKVCNPSEISGAITLGMMITTPSHEHEVTRRGVVVQVGLGYIGNMYRVEFIGHKGNYSECFYYENGGVASETLKTSQAG